MEIIHYHFDTLSSTNDWSKSHLSTFRSDALTVITADGQTAARGQYGRRWIAPQGLNLYASFCFFSPLSQSQVIEVTQVLALAAIKTVKKFGVDAKIKLPNDLRVDKKKLVGILCETTPLEEMLGIILGIGININMPQELIETVGQPATSLLLETHQLHKVGEVCHVLKQQFMEDLLLYLKQGFSPFEENFKASLENSFIY